MELNRSVRTVIDKLNEAGYEAYVVGGATRDFLLGKKPKDYDVCTNALPEEILDVFRDFHCLTTGLKHGTVSVIIRKEIIEVTTYRTDGEYRDHRHPEQVEFVDNLKEDLLRRDFTINALAYSPKTGIVDCTEGQSDLKRRIIRAIGDPDRRFSEDALRILRAIRFRAVYGFEIEERTEEAIHRNRELLNDVAIERKLDEFVRILESQKARETINEYEDIFGIRIKTRFKASDDLNMRLAIIVIDNELDVSVLKRMKYPNRVVRTVKGYLESMRAETDYAGICHLLDRLGKEDTRKLLLLKERYKEDVTSGRIILDSIISNNEVYSIGQLAVKGNELEVEDCQKTKVLKMLLDSVIRKETNNTREELMDKVKELEL